MKVAGFSFIKNAIIYDYPVLEAIQSVLPLCDEFVVAVGKSDDDTLGLIQSIADPRIRIVETEWDESQRQGGRVLALETDKAFQAISPDVDWAFYIQADEVMHEQYLEQVRKAMHRCLHQPEIDGLLFHYLHFYGSYDYVGASPKWYSREIRVVRNQPGIYSYRDAQGFRKGAQQKLNVYPIDAYIYHYGWVKAPAAMQRKQLNFNKYWHNDQWIEQHVAKAESFDYEQHMSQLKRFEGSHPAVMQARVQAKNWQFDVDISMNHMSLKERLKTLLKQYLGIDLGYKNYIIRRG